MDRYYGSSWMLVRVTDYDDFLRREIGLRKALALVASLALVMTMFTGVVFADAASINATLAFKTGESTEAGASSVIEVTVSGDGTNDLFNAVRVDFADSGFVPVGAPTSTTAGTGAVNNTEVTYTLSSSTTADFTVEIPVSNPDTVGSYGAGDGITVEVEDANSGWLTPAGPSTAIGPFVLDYTVEVTPEEGIIGSAGPVNVTIKEAGQIVDDTTIHVVIEDGATTTKASGDTNTGHFTGYVDFATTGPIVDTYSVTVDDGTYYGYATIDVKYDLQLDPIGTVNYQDVKAISGKILDGAGTGQGTWKVSIVNSVTAGEAAYAYTASDGSFTVQALFADATTYNIVLNDGSHPEAIYETIEVGPLGLDVTASGDLLGTVVTGTLDLTAVFGDTPAAAAEFTVTGPNDYEDTRTADGNGEASIGPITWNPGEYTVEVTWEDTVGGTSVDDPDRTGSTTFTVAAPEKLNYWVTPSDPFGPGARTIEIKVVDIDGQGVIPSTTTASEIAKVVYEVTGPIAQDITFDSSETGATFDTGDNMAKTLAVNVEQAGVVTVSGTVTYGDGSVETFEETIDVDGWVLDTETTLGTVGDIVTLRAIVTDPDGVPINNAQVIWTAANGFYTYDSDAGEYTTTTTGSIEVDAETTNISNGVYEIETKLATASSVTIEVQNQAGDDKAVLNGEIKGEEAYTVTVDKGAVIASRTEDIVVTVKDAEGDNITSLTALDVSGAGITKALGQATLYDADDDNFYDSYKFSVKATEVGDIEITASTDGGNKMGTATISAVAPAVDMPTAMTDSIEETITISLKDKDANGDPLTGKIQLTAVGGKLESFTDEDGTNIGDGNLLAEDAPHETAAVEEFVFCAVGTDVAEADEAVAPELKVEVSYDDGTNYIEVGSIAIEPADVAANLEELFIGISNSLDVTVKDAHGNALAERDVTLTGAASAAGSTDDNGLVQLTVTPNSTGTVTITVAGDASLNITETIRAVADTENPEIALDLPSVTTEASIPLKGIISDNTKLEKIYVNNEPILFIPGNEVDLELLGYELDLETGPNTFRFFVFDTAGNGAYVTETVTRREAVKIHMVLDDPNVTVNGEDQALDQAPVLEGGRTLVPLRFIGETLGGVVGWNPPIASVTIGDKVVEVSTVEAWAAVDGVEVEIDVPGKVINGRTMVPVRFISEAFGADVTYANGMVDIVY